MLSDIDRCLQPADIRQLHFRKSRMFNSDRCFSLNLCHQDKCQTGQFKGGKDYFNPQCQKFQSMANLFCYLPAVRRNTIVVRSYSGTKLLISQQLGKRGGAEDQSRRHPSAARPSDPRPPIRLHLPTMPSHCESIKEFTQETVAETSKDVLLNLRGVAQSKQIDNHVSLPLVLQDEDEPVSESQFPLQIAARSL